MRVIKTIKDMLHFSRQCKTEDKTIGFVPTMGALHEGHLSLVRNSKEANHATIVSIFINPTQFGPNEDFQKYPRETDRDLEGLSALHVDAVFMPDNNEMYPEGFSSSINIGGIGEILCGAARPGHFNGVATVVAKLFNIVKPERAYFGQKDFQQTVVMRKLVKELNYDIDIIACPTVREPDGLALSTRNAYLNEEERKAATVLYRALKRGEELIQSGSEDDASIVKKEVDALIKAEPLAKTDYIEVVDPHNLNTIERVMFAAILCIAVNIGNARLIDNIIVESK